MFSFLETICIENGLLKNLPYHQKRVNETFESFYPDLIPFDLSQVLSKQNIPSAGIYRLRIIYEEQIKSVEFIPYQEKKIATLKILNTGEFDYGFKWADRSYFEHILAENQEVDEVMFELDGKIQDCTIANLAFLKNGIWYTPKNPLHWGTTRARLIEQNKIKETDIFLNELSSYSHICLINVFRELSLAKSLSVSAAIL
jgi:4-amino-4-deoxychorismate lyase